MDKGRYTVMAFIDLKKASDSLDHEILLKKLKKYSVLGPENAWFASYLRGQNAILQSQWCVFGARRYQLGSSTRLLSWSSTVFDLHKSPSISLENGQVSMYVDDIT